MMNVQNDSLDEQVFMPEVSESSRTYLRRSDAWGFAASVTKRMNLRVYSVTPVIDAVGARRPKIAFCKPDGAPIMQLDNRRDKRWVVSKWSSMFSSVWEDCADSERLAYLTRNFLTHKTKAVKGIWDIMNNRSINSMGNDLVRLCVREAWSAARRGRVLSFQYKDKLTEDQVAFLLKYYLGQKNRSDTPPAFATAYEDTRAHNETYVLDSLQFGRSMEEFFAPTKWMVAYVPTVGYIVTSADLSEDKWSKVNTRAMSVDSCIRHAPTLYRTLDQIPENIRSDIICGLTMNKMFWRNRTTLPPIRYPEIEPHDMLPNSDIPSGSSHFSPEMSSIMAKTEHTTCIMMNIIGAQP